MSKFKKKKGGDLPAVNTASLPDIVFMLLFFFTKSQSCLLSGRASYPTRSKRQ